MIEELLAAFAAIREKLRLAPKRRGEGAIR
jgi:hypothetical protein